MADDEDNSNALDYTVFDLAERLAKGMTLSRAAAVEVSKELLAWREVIVNYATTGTNDGHRLAYETLRMLIQRACK